MTKLMAAAATTNQNRSKSRKIQKSTNSETVSLISSISNRSLIQYSKSSIHDINDCNLMKQKSISGEILQIITNNSEVDNRQRDNDCVVPIKNIEIANSNENLSFADTNSSNEKRKQNRERILETTPSFGMKNLTKEDVERIKEYLFEVCDDLFFYEIVEQKVILFLIGVQRRTSSARRFDSQNFEKFPFFLWPLE